MEYEFIIYSAFLLAPQFLLAVNVSETRQNRTFVTKFNQKEEIQAIKSVVGVSKAICDQIIPPPITASEFSPFRYIGYKKI